MFGKKSRNWITYSGIISVMALSSLSPAFAMPAANSSVIAGVKTISAQNMVENVDWRRRHRGRDAALAGAAGVVGGLIIGSAIANNNNGYYNDYPPPPPPRYYREPPVGYYYAPPPPPPPRRVVVERRYYEEVPSYGYYRPDRRPHYYTRQDERYSNY